MFGHSGLIGSGGRGGTSDVYRQIASLCWLLRGESLADMADGAALHSWRDESGGRHHMHQHHSGYCPTVDKTNLLNGHAGVTFGGNAFLIANDRLSFGSSITMFFAIYNSSVTGYNNNPILMDFGGGDPGSVHSLSIAGGAIAQVNWYFQDPWIDLSGVIATNTPYVLCIEVTNSPADAIDVWVNGSHQTQATSGNTNGIGYGVPNSGVGAGGGNDDPDAPRIGIGGASNSGNNWGGRVYEVAFFNEILSSTNRDLVENYLRAKYGV